MFFYFDVVVSKDFFKTFIFNVDPSIIPFECQNGKKKERKTRRMNDRDVRKKDRRKHRKVENENVK